MAGPRISEEVCQRVSELKAEGLTWAEMGERMRQEMPEEFGQLSTFQARNRCRNAFERQRLGGAVEGRPAAVKPKGGGVLELLNKGISLSDLGGRLGVSQRVAEAMVEDLKDQGYNLQEQRGVHSISRILPPTDNWVMKPWGRETTLRFGLVSDTHIGGVDAQITLLHHLYDRFAMEGITDVYHAGDLTDGEKMRAGQEYELYMHGADAQVEHTVKVYPRRNGMTTTFITGNHDYSFVKTLGLDIGRQIAAQRPDMVYAGYMSAIIQLSPGCTLELRHPQDGSAYAMSYKPQKIIEALSGGEKPSIMAIGHYHKMMYMEYRSIHSLLCGTTAAQTMFMRGKGLSAHMGGIIVELKLREDGVISEFTPRFIPFYAATKDDYKNWL